MTSALASSKPLPISFNSLSTVVLRPPTVIDPGPRLCASSWNRVSSVIYFLVTCGACSGTSTRSAIGFRMRSYLAPSTLARMTFLAPLASRTFSSLGRLKAIVWTPGTLSPPPWTWSATAIGDSNPRCEILILGVDRKILLHAAQLGLIFVERRRFRRVAQRHERLERGLPAVERVGVGLVRPDRDLDRRVLQVHPRQLGFEIIVGPERLRAQRQEFLQARIGGDRRRLLEQLGGRLEPLLIGLAVRHRDQLVALPPDHRIGAGQRLLLARIGLQISVERLLGQVGRIEAPARRLGRGAEERLVLVEAIPRPEIGIELRQQHFLVGVAAIGDLRADLVVIGRDLAPVDFRHLARRLDQQIDHLLFLGVEEAGVGVHLNDSRASRPRRARCLGLRSGGVVGRDAASGKRDGQSGSGDQPAVFGHGRLLAAADIASQAQVRRRLSGPFDPFHTVFATVRGSCRVAAGTKRLPAH